MSGESRRVSLGHVTLRKSVVAIGMAIVFESGAVACLAPSNATVPDVRGKSQADATQALSEQHLRLLSSGEVSSGAQPGTVVDQNPPTGTTVAADSVVTATFEEARATVPGLSGKSVADARDMLTVERLIPGKIVEQITGGAPGTVVAQDPAQGAPVLHGSKVNLTVEASQVTVPDLFGA